MGVRFPAGCNLFYGDHFDNYNNGILTRYYITGAKWWPTERETYTTEPDSDFCATTYYYKPELEVEFSFYAFIIVSIGFWLLYRVFIKRLLP